MPKGATSLEHLEKLRVGRVALHERRKQEKNSVWIIDSNNVVHIPLTRGYEAIIDIEDVEEARRYAWHAHVSKRSRSVYAGAWIPGFTNPKKQIFLHNLVFKPAVGKLTDHIDRDGLNCRRCNLREANAFQNAQNKNRVLGNNPYTGVFQRANGKWTSHIMINKKWVSLGTFLSKEEALNARKKAAVIHYADFAAKSQ